MMNREPELKFAKHLVVGLAMSLVLVGGCHSTNKKQGIVSCGSSCEVDAYQTLATEIEYPDTVCGFEESEVSLPPVTLSTDGLTEYTEMSLESALQIGLSNSKVLQDLGGVVLKSPGSVETVWDTAIQEADPRFGVEAALAAFDAQFSASLFGEKNDRALNNQFFGGGTRILNQDAAVFQAQITKRAVTGSEFSIRHNVEYDSNNAPGNQFTSAWNTNIEAEMRHPLLQGGGMLFNRIAGPSRTPGSYNGVLLARINTDVELSKFEMSVRDLASNIENAYWDLYFAYRDLDSKIKARNSALVTWRKIHALFEMGRRGGEAEKEAQAREQFFRFQEEVQNAQSGRLVDGTRTGNGSSGGTFRGSGGVQVAERRLRLLLGLSTSDGRLVRPSDEPVMVPIKFDWNTISEEVSTRRVELRRQRWEIRRRELELVASKNHLMPRLDMVGRYRWRGFGDDLLHSNKPGSSTFNNAYGNMTGGGFQEWQLGLELNVPIGYRRAHSAVRHAEHRLSRERAVLAQQKKEVLHELSAAIAEVERAFAVSQTSGFRLAATEQQLAAVKAAYEADKAPLDLLLDAQRRLAEAQSRLHRTHVEYVIAIKNVHYAKGTLLTYDSIRLSEGPWNRHAYHDASKREARRGRSRKLNYISARAPRVSQGLHTEESLLIHEPVLQKETEYETEISTELRVEQASVEIEKSENNLLGQFENLGTQDQSKVNGFAVTLSEEKNPVVKSSVNRLRRTEPAAVPYNKLRALEMKLPLQIQKAIGDSSPVFKPTEPLFLSQQENFSPQIKTMGELMQPGSRLPVQEKQTSNIRSGNKIRVDKKVKAALTLKPKSTLGLTGNLLYKKGDRLLFSAPGSTGRVGSVLGRSATIKK